jgi:hypothetical protein
VQLREDPQPADADVIQTLDLTEEDQIIRIDGVDRVPKFELTSDDGTTVSRDRDTEEPIFGPDRDWVVLSDERTDTAYVLLKEPEGSWQLDGRSGPDAIEDVDVAESVPPPEVDARITGNGRHRVLRWRADGLTEHDRITFSEKPRGSVSQPIGTTDEASGSMRFKPTVGFSRRHALSAIVSRNGTPFDEIKLSSFQVRPPIPPARPHNLRISQRTNGIVVRWGPATRARGYVAVLKGADGSFEIPKMTGPNKRRVRFEAPPITTNMRVQVYALGRIGTPGRPLAKSFRTHGRLKTVDAAARRLVGSANVLGDGDLEFIGACPPRGHCRAEIEVRSRGSLIGRRNAVLVPKTLRDLIVEIDGEARKRLAERGRLRVAVEATIRQRGQVASRERSLTLRTGA